MLKGYKVKFSGVVEANADNPNSLLDAQKKMDAAEDALRDLGFTMVKRESKYTNNIGGGTPAPATPDNGVASHV